jgi:hypothetical protein
MSHWKKCSVEGCAAIAAVRGWCNAHYKRWLHYGDVLADRPISKGAPLTFGPRPRRLKFAEPGDKSRIQEYGIETEDKDVG